MLIVLDKETGEVLVDGHDDRACEVCDNDCKNSKHCKVLIPCG